MLLHANGNDMQVAYESLPSAISRIAASYGKVTSCKRLAV